MRAVLEWFSKGKVLKKRTPVDLGRRTIFVSPDASLRFWKPGLQSDLFDFARSFVKPGDAVWDVGANVGLFSVAAAEKAGTDGRVISIEADIWLVGLLRKTASAQPETSAKIEVLSVAVDRTLGIASFNIAKRGRASNYLASMPALSQTGGVRESVHVITVTLDWLLDQVGPPAVLKIDVEHAEVEVLKGAERVLSEGRPVILCEVQSASRSEVTSLLRRHRYKMYDWDSSPWAAVEQTIQNTLALPEEWGPLPPYPHNGKGNIHS